MRVSPTSTIIRKGKIGDPRPAAGLPNATSLAVERSVDFIDDIVVGWRCE
jgi:hypothetical protein